MAIVDSTHQYKVKYWVDDSTKSGIPIEYQFGKSLKIKISTTGKHVIYGKIQMINNGMYIWRDWEYDFYVEP